MIKLLRWLAAVFVLASTAARAASLSPDVTGFWHNPNEPGWGAAIAQQDDVLFVSLLVYDEQRRPEWLVAGDVRDAGGGVFSGTLYRTSGSALGAAFDPALVQSRAVGTLSIQYAVNFGGQASLRLGYTVDGVAVTKGLVRLTWASNAARLPGAYFGGIVFNLAAVSQLNGCPAQPELLPPGGQFRINMSVPATIAIIQSEGIDTVTVIGGEYAQSGQFGVITGGVFRGPIVSPLRIADAQVTNIVASDDGFFGHVRIVIGSCLYEGAIGGIRR